LVDLGCGFNGSFNPHDRKYKIGNHVPVRLRNPVVKTDRGGRPVPVIPLGSTHYKIVKKHLPVAEMTIEKITEHSGNVGRLTCQITDIYQLRNGPTLFTMTDAYGTRIQGSAFGDGMGAAFPTITRGTVVKVVARFRIVNEKDRLQIYTLDKVKSEEALEFIESLAGINQTSNESLENINFYVESGIYESLKPNFIKAAMKLRSAILRNQSIVLRYHSPCVDGVSAAFAIDYALKRYLQIRGVRRDEYRRYIRRLPQRNPIFEIREIVRDLTFSLDDGANYKNLPLYVLIDVGSSEDSKAALDLCKAYGIDVIIVDNHHLADSIEEKAHTLINPNSIDPSNSITSGMLATELAKFIAAEQDIDKRTLQLAAISGFSDKSESNEYNSYLELAEANEFDKPRIDNITSAVDYVIFGLRHMDGGEVVRNLLGVSGTHEKNTELIESITPTAKSLFSKSLKVAVNSCEEQILSNKVKFVTLDLDNYAPRFDYPSHSSLIAALYTSKLEEEGGNVFTLGIASDYIIIRSSALDFVFDAFLNKLLESHPSFGIKGSGHRSSGSIQFYAGHKEIIVEEIKKLIG
jgi:RecJ-like exonuclease